MFPKRLVYVFLRFHQAFHLPQGFETFLLLYSRANFTQLIQSCLLRVVNLQDRTFTVSTAITAYEKDDINCISDQFQICRTVHGI